MNGKAKPVGKPNAFGFFDYREYLKALFDYKKSLSPFFSHRGIVRKAGYSSPNLLKNVIDGKRHLSLRSAECFAKVFGMDDPEQKYFLALVRFNLAGSLREKEKLLAELMELKHAESPYQLGEKHYDVLSNWWHLPICEATGLPDFRNSSKWVSQVMQPGIGKKEASQSLTLLKKLGLIEKKAGRWSPVQKTLKTDPQVASVLAANFHREMIRLGGEAITRFPPEWREISGTILRISKEDMERVRIMLRQFREKIMKVALHSKNADQIIELNFQLFPLVMTSRNKRLSAKTLGIDK